MKELIFGFKYIINRKLFGQNIPLICGIVLHNKCNLNCRHCTVINRQTKPVSYDEAVDVINSFYDEGGRCLYLEGGEPFIWKTKEHTMEDIVTYARKKGYYAVIIYTNGTIPLESTADTIFVSVDGLQKTHDFLRGTSFVKIMNNIQQSNHPSIYINFTINTYNKDEIADFCAYVDDIPQIRGTFFYFHTPYYGYDELYLDKDAKNDILLKLLDFKSQYKILNSRAGLKSAIKNNWKRNLDICRVYEDGKYYSCCRENKDGEVCKDCGYLSYAEIDQSLKLKPGALFNALKYF